MHGQVQSRLARYCAAIGLVVLALVVNLALGQLDPLPAAMFLAAVTITGWIGGLGPALLATFLSVIALDYFCLPDFHSLDPGPATWVWLLVFVAAALVITLLQDMQRRLTSAVRLQDERKRRFMMVLAHELRNYLSPISLAVAALQMNAKGDETAEQACAAADRQVRNMGRLINDLLDVARINEGKVSLKRERVDLGSIVSQAVDVATPLINERQHVLETFVPSGPLDLEADATRLGQVFVNLLTNAAKYTDPGGRIWLTVGRGDREWVVKVRDNGKGLTPEALSHVFDLFMQVESGSHGGLGIGLNLVRGLVQMHGGSVAASSAGPGRGSEFVVRLPLAGPTEIGP